LLKGPDLVKKGAVADVDSLEDIETDSFARVALAVDPDVVIAEVASEALLLVRPVTEGVEVTVAVVAK